MEKIDMERKDIRKETERLIAANRLNGAIEFLRKSADEVSGESAVLSDWHRNLERLEETYKYMREYLLNGMEDSGRKDLYENLKEDLRHQASILKFLSESATSPTEFFSSYRLGRFSHSTLADLAEEYRKADFRIEKAEEMEMDPAHFVKRKEELLDNIFRQIWVAAPWDKETTGAIKAILTDENSDFDLKSQTVSALMLSLLSWYDADKTAILLDAYSEEKDERMAARMLTVIIPVINRWSEEVGASAKLRGKLEFLADSILTYTRLRDILMTMIRTRDTDRVSNEIKETFDIAMKNISPEMLERLRKEGLNIEAGELGENPEWDRLMNNSDLEQRMMNINEMQTKGMDVMMESFGRLKHFPFFRDISHWFLPFNAERSEIVSAAGDSDLSVLDNMANALEICGSDRYSFAFGFATMPKERRDAMLSNIGMANEMIAEQFKKDITGREKSAFAREALSFSRDLYRFFKLYPKKEQFFNIFANPVDFLSLPVVGRLLEEEEILTLIGNFYFDYGYYALAGPLFERSVKGGTSDMQIFEKLGYCHQMNGNISEALANYNRAELFSSDTMPASAWLLRKLAFCNKLMRNYESAAEYYTMLLERDSDDFQAEINLGNVLLLDNNVEEGLNHLSKIHYMEPDNRPCTRAYVRGLVMRGEDPESTFKTALKLVTDSSTEEDFRLIGHAAFLAGKLKEAEEFYAHVSNRSKITEELNFLSPKRFDPLTLDILLDIKKGR